MSSRRVSNGATKYAPPMHNAPSFLSALVGSSVDKSTARAISDVPREFLVRDLKEKRKFRLLARKLTVFVTFVTIYLAVLLLDRNISGRSAVRHIISTELITSTRAASGMTFAAITSAGAFWDWFANSFVVSVYATMTSDGLARTDDELFTIASHTTIVGGFHVLQTRYAAVNTSSANSNTTTVAQDNPCSSYLAPTVNQTCFTATHESIDAFGVSNGSMADAAELQALDMFRYSLTVNDSTGGFQTYFLRRSASADGFGGPDGGDAALATVTRMRTHRWIDRQTKAVEITMPLYNTNLKLWSIVHLRVTFDLAGGVTPTAAIHVANLEPYNLSRTRNVVRVVLEAIYVLHVVYFVLVELWDVCVLSSGSIRTYVAKYGLVNNVGDWANIGVNVAIIVWRYLCQSNATRQHLLAIASFDDYVEALALATWDEVLLVLNVSNMLLLTARALKYFQVTNGGRRLMNSIYGAMPEVLSFLPIYLSVLIGYTFVGHMLYGLSFPEWSTFPRAFFRVFELNFGLYDPGPIYDNSGYMSVVFLYSSNVVFCILMLNVFMAIVMSTWDTLSAHEAEIEAERAQFARKLGLVDLAHLLIMREDVVDVLLDVAGVSLEASDSVTKELFSDAVAATGVDISTRTWANICSWYWNNNDVKRKNAIAASQQAPVASVGQSPTTLSPPSIAAAPAAAMHASSTPSHHSSTLSPSQSWTDVGSSTAAMVDKPASTASNDLVVVTSPRTRDVSSAASPTSSSNSTTSVTINTSSKQQQSIATAHSAPPRAKATAKVYAVATPGGVNNTTTSNSDSNSNMNCDTIRRTSTDTNTTTPTLTAATASIATATATAAHRRPPMSTFMTSASTRRDRPTG